MLKQTTMLVSCLITAIVIVAVMALGNPSEAETEYSPFHFYAMKPIVIGGGDEQRIDVAVKRFEELSEATLSHSDCSGGMELTYDATVTTTDGRYGNNGWGLWTIIANPGSTPGQCTITATGKWHHNEEIHSVSLPLKQITGQDYPNIDVTGAPKLLHRGASTYRVDWHNLGPPPGVWDLEAKGITARYMVQRRYENPADTKYGTRMAWHYSPSAGRNLASEQYGGDFPVLPEQTICAKVRVTTDHHGNGAWSDETCLTMPPLSPDATPTPTPVADSWNYECTGGYSSGPHCTKFTSYAEPAPGAHLSPEPSRVNLQVKGDEWHFFTLYADEDVSIVANPSGSLGAVYTSGSDPGGANRCSAPNNQPLTGSDGDYIYVAGCAAGPTRLDIKQQDTGRILHSHVFSVGTSDTPAEPPSAPAAPVVSKASSTGLNVQWSAPENSGPPITGYQVRYRPADQTPDPPWTGLTYTGTGTSAAITGLPVIPDDGDDDVTTFKRWNVQVRANNVAGYGPWSRTSQWTQWENNVGSSDTPAEPPSAPAAPVVSKASSTGLNVQWSAPENSGPPITGYDVRYRPADQTPEASWASLAHQGTATTASITGLPVIPNDNDDAVTGVKTFEVQVRAGNEDGDSPWSASGKGTQWENNPPYIIRVPADLFVLTENWQGRFPQPLLPTYEPDGDSITWSVGGRDADFVDIGSDGVLTSVPGKPIDFEYLQTLRVGDESTVLKITIIVTDPHGETDEAARVYRIFDLPEPPGSPDAPTVTASSATSLKATWREPDNTGPEISDYDLRYSSDGGASWAEWQADTTITATTATITGLTADTAYQVQVRARNDEGTGAWSASGSASTQAAAGRAPEPADEAEECFLKTGENSLPWAMSNTVLAECSIGYVTARRIYYFQAEQSGGITIENTTAQGDAWLRLKEAAGFGKNLGNLTGRIAVGGSASAEVDAGQWYALMLLGSADGQTVTGTVSGSGGLTGISTDGDG